MRTTRSYSRKSAAKRIQGAFRRYRKRRLTTKTVKKIVVNQKPTKFHQNGTGPGGQTSVNSLAELYSVSALPYSSDESDAYYKREAYKVHASGLYLKGEILAAATNQRVQVVRVLLVKGMRAGNLNINDIELNQPGFTLTDPQYFFPNNKDIKVVWDHTFKLQAQAAGAVYPPSVCVDKYFKMNETWRYPSADPSILAEPINPGSYRLYTISNIPILNNPPKVDLNTRLSFKDL